MVDEKTVARVVKALVSRFGPTSRTKSWLVRFSGLSTEYVSEVLAWLRLRRLVTKKSGCYHVSPIARETIDAHVRMRSTNFMSALEDLTHQDDESSDSSRAQAMFRHYHECLSVRARGLRGFYRNGIPLWSTQTQTTRTHFARVAEAAVEVGADPLVYVQSQFAAFDQISAYKKEAIIPYPHGMYGAAAQGRYAKYKAELEDRDARAAPKRMRKAAPATADIEEFRLKGMMRHHGISEITVLRRFSHHFSKAFLKRKGVWAQVKDAYYAATDMSKAS